jgi:hypothetical protein
MSNNLNIPATLVIDQDALIDVLKKAMEENAGQLDEPQPAKYPFSQVTVPVHPDPDEATEQPAKRKPGRPKKAKAEEDRAQKTSNLHLKIDSSQPQEIQFKSAIVQSAMQAHGDAIGRKIMQNWTDEDTKAVQFAMSLYGVATLQTVAKASADTPESELTKSPRLFLMAIFKKAAELSEIARPVSVPRENRCGICEGVGAHSPGCPNGISAQLRREAATDGGAVPSRVPNAAIPAQAAEKPEICAVGGAAGGCPIPQHGMILQGGAHIPVHPPEVLRALRASMEAAPPAVPQFSLPQPPVKRGPGRPKKAK